MSFFVSVLCTGPRLYRLGLAWLAFSAPLGYCIFHNTTATLYYLSDCMAALLDVFWFLPWLRGILEYILLMPYRLLCFFTGGGYYEEVWKKVLEILLREYSEREREALKVSHLVRNCVLRSINTSSCARKLTRYARVSSFVFLCRCCLWQRKPLFRR